MPRSDDAAATDAAAAGAGLAGVLRLLSCDGRAAFTDALLLAAADIGCAELTLRLPDGSQHPVPSTEVPAQRDPHPWTLDCPIRRGDARLGLLRAGSARPLTPRQAALLTSYADVLGLVLDAERARTAADPGRTILDAEADRAQLAAALHESIGQALVTVRYTADLVSAGRGAAAALDEPVRAALAAFRHAHRDLRAHALEAGLRAALRELAVQAAGDRPADDQPVLRLSLDANDPALDRLPPPIAVTVQRVAEAALRGATGWATLAVACNDARVKLSVQSADIAYDASELDRWSRRASALGGHLAVEADGVELNLPVELALPDQREGRHDHGFDL